MKLNVSAKVRKFIKEMTEEDIKELEPAAKEIECEYCDSRENVLYYGCGNLGFFYCYDCIKKIQTEEVETYSPKGLSLRFRVLMRDKFRCVYCGRSPREDGVKLEVDHVHPKSKGGSDTMDNLVAACRDCNQGKKDLIIGKGID